MFFWLEESAVQSCSDSNCQL